MSGDQINWFKELMETTKPRKTNDNEKIKLGLMKFRSLSFSPNYEGRVFKFYFFFRSSVQNHYLKYGIVNKSKLSSFWFENIRMF